MDILTKIILSLFGGFICGAIIVTVIEKHITKYCRLINIDITDIERQLGVFGNSKFINENTIILNKHIKKLMIIYSLIFATIIFNIG
jgi:hypothetical protein